jgi:ferredoxin
MLTFLVSFCIVIIRCTETFWSFCTISTAYGVKRCLITSVCFTGRCCAHVPMFQKIERASTVLMDRWKIEVSEQKDDGSHPGDPIPYNIINNYFSVGVVRTVSCTTCNICVFYCYYYITFTAKIDHSQFNNSCLRLPASTLVNIIFQSRSFSLGRKIVQQLQYI